MSNPVSVLESLRAFIVDALIAVPEFQPLTQWTTDAPPVPMEDADGNPISAILALKKGDLLTAVQQSINRCGLSIGVFIASFHDDDSQTTQVQFNPVEITIEISEHVTTNQNAASGGTELSALYVAERIAANLKELQVTGVTGCTAVISLGGPIRNTTTAEEAAAGYDYYNAHFKTRAVAAQRSTP